MFEDFNNIKKDIQDYFDVRLDQIKLHTAENLSRILTNAASIAIIGYLLFFILMFISFAAGYFFANLTNSNELGFLCVAGFYFVVLIIFLLFRKQVIEKPVIKAIVKLFFPNFVDNEK
jgi:hypothetical protein